MSLPNFLIIGAAKSGTTGLYHYLSQHPQIFMSAVKEPGFFALEGRELDFRGPGDSEACREGTTSLEAYEALFRDVRGAAAVGEASTAYLSTPGAAERIRHYMPDAKLIVILRNPVERAYSNFLHMMRDGREPHHDFQRALQDEEARMRDNWEPIWQYRTRGFYAAQLRHYFKIFERERVKIYLSQDLRLNAQEVMSDVFRFLEVDDAFRPNVSTDHNVSGVPKHRSLHTFLSNRHPLKSVLKTFIPRPTRQYLSATLYDRNLIKPPLSPELRAQLVETYREDIMNLQGMIGRDLSAWLR